MTEPTPAEQDAQVTDEAVEAAWSEMPQGPLTRDDVRNLLTAAAPFIRAQNEREHRAQALEDAAHLLSIHFPKSWLVEQAESIRAGGQIEAAAPVFYGHAAAEREGGADRG